ncbi:MAG TPA: multicopper oxidase domain-containing protein [Solirubrobacterales bacterium]|jgi:FtsP/CotA-like multicopper oxidase with cupredoxin domain|nr:multicopper oxidase domain-containing protein [Solirubrobacterales bacterium]
MKQLLASSDDHGLRTRRLLVLLLGFAASVALFLIAFNPFVSATSGGSPYAVPAVVDTNPAPNIVETTLTSEEATVDIGNGTLAHAQTFNGQLPGPTFSLNVGDTVIVHYQNNLNRESGIHWHGIELANAVDGTPFTQNQVPPGGNFLYKFTVTRPGLYWYHPHHHASTNQVFKGLYGAIVVKDPNETALQASGTLPPAAQTKPIVLSDVTVCKTKGTNDAATYNPALPHVSGGALPAQSPPTPKNLCEGPGLAGPPPNPYPVDEDGTLRAPFAASDIPNIQTALHAGPTNEGQTVLTNGKNVGARAGTPAAPGALASGASVLDVQPGQGLRLQLVNSSTVRFFRLRLTTPTGALVPLIRVGGEGGLLNNAVIEGGTQGTWVTKYGAGEILLPPGTRADVVAAIPSAPTSGVLTLWTEDFERTGAGYSNIPTVPVMHLNLAGAKVTPAYTIAAGTPLRAATGDPVETLGAPSSILLNPATFTPAKKGLPSKVIELTQKAQTELSVDKFFGTHDVTGDYADAPHLGSSRYAKQGDTLELEVKNVTGANHPFHLHGFSIQPKSLTNGAETYTWTYPEFRDNVDVPGGFTLKYRIRLDPRALADGVTPGGALGRWVFHCHIFFHATDGMLSELVITAPNGNERPDVNVDNSELAVTQGGTATVTGTYEDPDGSDPVTLSSSVGTVVDNGNGTFTWTYPTTAADSTQIVYVTATDSNGLKGQIPFYLKVNPGSTPAANVAPVLKRLRVTPKRFLSARGKTKLQRANVSARVRRGAKIGFTLSEPAKVRFVVKRLVPRRPRVKTVTFSRNIKKAGKRTVRFTANFKRRGALPPGKYKLTAQATDSGGLKSKQASTRFKIAFP